MKFLHTADLHLDSAFCSSGALGAEQQRQRQRELLKKIFNLANKESCDIILCVPSNVLYGPLAQLVRASGS